jgi:hypothetical protein
LLLAVLLRSPRGRSLLTSGHEPRNQRADSLESR